MKSGKIVPFLCHHTGEAWQARYPWDCEMSKLPVINTQSGSESLPLRHYFFYLALTTR